MARLRYVDLSGTVGSGGLTNVATTHTFTAPLTYAAGTPVPTLVSPDYFMLTILNAAGTAVSEVVKVTAYNSGTGAATIVRGQEGTAGAAHSSGDKVLTAAYPSDFATTTRPLVDPTVQSWSWINQGSSPAAAVSTQGEAILLSSAVETADNWHFRAKSVPSKPYSVIVHMLATYMNVNFPGWGVGWLQTSNNRFAVLNQRGNNGAGGQAGPFLESSYSTTNYVLTNNYSSIIGGESYPWIKLTDDATNRKIYVSMDGYNWVLFHSVATNDQVTPDRLVFGIEARNTTYGIALLLDSWEEGV